MGPGVSVPMAARLAPIPYSTLDYWIRSKLVLPTVEKAGRGPGNFRAFSLREMVAIRTLAAFRQFGVSLQGLRRIVTYLRKNYADIDESMSGVRLELRGNSVMLLRGDDAVDVLRSPGQAVLSLDMGELVRDTHAAVERADRDAMTG